MRRYLFFALVLIFGLFFSRQLMAQNTTGATNATQISSKHKSSTNSYWADLALGIGTAGGGSGGIALNFQRNRILLTALADEQFDNSLFSTQSFWEYGATAGIATAKRNPFFSAFSLGIASVGHKKCVENCGILDGPAVYKTRKGVGIPMQLRLDWRPFRFVGVGILGMADINFIKSFGSINLNVQAGYF